MFIVFAHGRISREPFFNPRKNVSRCYPPPNNSNNTSIVDFVYLWCDGDEPAFAARKQARLKETNPDKVNENIGDVRYIQHDELRYALRSVNKYAPWARHIYIVTDRQRPAWLKDHPKVTVIDHKSILPEALLPVFSSICIEMYLDRIPGLSEQFIYSNDDIFLNRPLEEKDFFTEDGAPIVWMSKKKAKKITPEVGASILSDNSINNWQKTVIRAWALYRERTGSLIPYYYPAHSVDAYTKTCFRQVIEKYPELRRVNSTPFRTGKDISRALFSYEMIGSMQCPVEFTEEWNFWARLKNRVFPVEMLTLCQENVKKLKRNIRVFNPKTFCLNNLTPEQSMEGIEYLRSRFPDPAPWEK